MPEQEDTTTTTPVIDALKVGARHSARDNEALQSIHDGAVTLGALCARPSEVNSEPILKDDTLISFGSEVKMLDNGHLGGYLVTFTDETRPDLTGDFFTKATDFGKKKETDCFFNHCMPIKGYGLEQVIGEGKLSIDDVGVFIDAILTQRDDYEKAIAHLAGAGKMGWSSGTAPHLVQREPKGGAQWIKRWPLGFDASITPTPAEPMNKVISLKSYSALEHTATEPIPNSEPEAVPTAVQEVEETGHNQLNPIKEAIKMTDQVDFKALIESAVAEATKAFIAVQPTANAAGVSVVKDEGDQPWEKPGDFFKAVKNFAYRPNQIDPRLAAVKAPTGLNEGVPSQGGFLIPPAMAAGIIQKMNGVGTVLSYFPPLGVEGNGMVWNVVDETSRANGSRMGGVTGYWLNEAGSKTSSKPKFRQLELKLKKVAALAYATDELLEDASALGGWLAREVPNELRFMVEDSIFNGDGVGKPEGILGSAALKSATRTDASEIDALDIGRMWAARYPYANDYVWFVNPTTFPQLLTLSIGQQPVYIGPGGLGGLPYGTLLGRPVIETEYNPSLGTLGDILLISPSQYYLIDKASGIQTASSIHVAFTTDETAFRFVYRVDGAPLWYTTLTGKDSNTYSPYVALAAST